VINEQAVQNYAQTGRRTDRRGSRGAITPVSGAFQCADGWWMISVPTGADRWLRFLDWVQDPVLAAKTTGAAAVIRNGNNGRKFRDWPIRIGVLVAPPDDIFLEAAQKGGKSGASSKRYNSESASERPRFVRFFLHRVTE